MPGRLFAQIHVIPVSFLIPFVLSGLISCGDDDAGAVVCGDGTVQAGEECDDGPANGRNGQCTPTCILNVCGDGLLLNGTEQCDNGPRNSNTAPNSCRADCLLPHCGDSVIDSGEQCDHGSENSDEEPDACRLNCVPAACGDGAVDTNEECDSGPANSDTLPDACRVDCSAPSCGDGIIDGEETCDNSDDNSNTVPDACREDCSAASCGDSVVDSGERCDHGAQNSDTQPEACSTTCSLPSCDPAEVPFSSHASTGALTGQREDKVTVTCDSGYSGGGDWFCGFGALFSGPACDPIPCVPTETAHSVAHSGTGSIKAATGETVLVACAPGHAGGGEWTCSANGADPGVLTGPGCTPSECPAAAVLYSADHGAAGTLTGVTGDTVEVTCGAGYLGGGTWTCSPGDSTESAFTGPSCAPIPCAPTLAPNSVSHTTPGSITGATGDAVEVVCDSGYEGGGTWTCQPTGVSDAFFTGQACTPIACVAATVPNSTHYSEAGTLTGATGDTANAVCKEGYTGGGEWTCSANGSEAGTFTGGECAAAECIPTETPNSLLHSEPGSITGVTGTKVIVQCVTGYSPGGVWTCNTNGTLTGATCTANTCTSTEAPFSDYKTSFSIKGTVDSSVVVTCDQGYTGGGEWTCGSNEKFFGPECVYSTCDPTATPHSDYAGADSIQGMVDDTVEVTCEEGYTGGGTWTCSSDLTFFGSPCAPNPCTPTTLANSDHASEDSISGVTGDTVEVACSSGYSGGGQWTCRTDGTFSAGAPCAPNPCDVTDAPNHGNLGDCPALLQSGSTCQPTCEAGYYATGSTSCQAGALAAARCGECFAGTYSTVGSSECTAITLCGPGHGVVAAATTSSDTVCEACVPGETWNTTEDATTACAQVRECAAGRGVSALATATSNTVCETCVAGTGYSDAADANQSCIAVSTCGAGTGVASAPTVNSDTVCEACDEGTTYSDLEDSVQTCKAVSTCVAGDGVSSAPLAETDTVCGTCTAGTDWNNTNDSTSACVTIQTCSEGSGVATVATATSDTVCEACVASATWNPTEDSTSECAAITPCPLGEGVTTEATTTSDTVCEACVAGVTWSPTEDITSGCAAVTPCSLGEGVATAATTTSDTVCEACVPGETWNLTEDATNGCAAVAPCPLGEGLATAATATSDTVCEACVPGATWNQSEDATTGCTPISTCTEGEGVATAATAEANTQCQACVPGVGWNNTDDSTSGCRPITTCTTGKAATAVATATSNTQCQACVTGVNWSNPDDTAAGCTAITTCPEGQGVTTLATTLADTVCEPCVTGAAWNGANDATTGCTAITTCTQGNGVATPPTAEADTVCEECVTGVSWNGANDATTGCTAITTCPQGAEVAAVATAEADTSCGACVAGVAWGNPDDPAAGCTPITTCTEGNGVVTLATAEADTVCEECVTGVTWNGANDATTGCTAITTCPQGAEVVAAATAEADTSCGACVAGVNWGNPADPAAGCTPITTCTEGNGMVTLATAEADTVCEECVTGVSWNGADDATTGCTAITTCTEGAEVVAAATAEADTSCGGCVVGVAWDNPDDTAAGCTPITTCTEGNGMATLATAEADTVCEPCVLGVTWNGANDATTGCAAITTCPQGAEVVAVATVEADTSCGACIAGVNWSNPEDPAAGCTPITTCTEGNGVATPPTAEADTVCEACVPGVSWNNSNDATTGCATPVSSCPAGEGVQTEATANSDTVCEECAEGTSWSNTSSATEACQSVTACSNEKLTTLGGNDLVADAKAASGGAPWGDILWSDTEGTGKGSRDGLIDGVVSNGINDRFHSYSTGAPVQVILDLGMVRQIAEITIKNLNNSDSKQERIVGTQVYVSSAEDCLTDTASPPGVKWALKETLTESKWSYSLALYGAARCIQLYQATVASDESAPILNLRELEVRGSGAPTTLSDTGCESCDLDSSFDGTYFPLLGNTCLGRSLDALAGHLSQTVTLSSDDKNTVTETIMGVLDQNPQDSSFIWALLHVFAESVGWTSITPDNPFNLDNTDASWDPLKTVSLHIQEEVLLHLPAADLPIHPNAVDFPGAVATATARVTRTRTIDGDYTGFSVGIGKFGPGNPNAPRRLSTGLYAAPGDVVRVSAPPAVVNTGADILIGAHTDSNWGRDSLNRHPKITRAWPLSSPTIEVGNAWGGLIYVRVPVGASLGDFDVTIENAVEAPRFIRGETSVADWKTTLRDLPVPWAEIEGNQYIQTVPSSYIRTLDNPDELTEWWDNVLKIQHDLSGYLPWPRVERAVYDVQISGGAQHSGYPFMAAPDHKAGWAMDLAGIANDPNLVWGNFHELGHNHQWNSANLPGAGEASCNLFAIKVMIDLVGLDWSELGQAHGNLSFAKRREKTEAYFAADATIEWGVWYALETYLQVVEEFGWAPLEAAFTAYYTMTSPPTDDDGEFNRWVVEFSLATQRDLSAYHEAWGFPITDDTRSALSDLTEWRPNPLDRWP